jgi:putative cell wall-binding protein
MTRSKAAILGTAILILALFSLAGGALGGGYTPPPPGDAPAILGIDPTSGPTTGGNEVVIEGSGFTGTGEYAIVEPSGAGLSEACYSWGVKFGEADALSFCVTSDSRIVAVAPPQAAGVVDVTVTANGVTSANTEADNYEYYVAETTPPTITSIEPDTGPTGGGTKVIIRGTGFVDVGESAIVESAGAGLSEACYSWGVTFGGEGAKNFVVKSPTEIWAYSPAHEVGAVQVKVTTAAGSSEDTDADDFTYYQAPLAITGLEPKVGPSVGGNKVSIYGTGFYQVGEGLEGSYVEGIVSEACSEYGVTFGGVPALGYSVCSDTLIKAIAPPGGELGTVQVKVNTAAGSTADTDKDDYTYDVTFTSILGSDRYSTAIKISQAVFPTGLPAESGLVLAPGDSYQEALCGAPLAAAYGGPILLTPKLGLNPAVRAEIIRLHPKYVICIGLSDAIKNSVQAALGSSGVASVIRGRDVYEMSYKVAVKLGEKVGDMSGATAIIARGDTFADAIGATPLACAKKWPILLTNGAGGPLNGWAVAALHRLGITSAIKIGTYCILPPGVTGIANLSGSDRYHTNKNLAGWAHEHAGLSFEHAGFATGDKFPDALAAGPYLAMDEGILLLSPLYGPLPACISAEFAANAGSVEHTSFFACITRVQTQVRGLVP